MDSLFTFPYTLRQISNCLLCLASITTHYWPPLMVGFTVCMYCNASTYTVVQCCVLLSLFYIFKCFRFECMLFYHLNITLFRLNEVFPRFIRKAGKDSFKIIFHLIMNVQILIKENICFFCLLFFIITPVLVKLSFIILKQNNLEGQTGKKQVFSFHDESL